MDLKELSCCFSDGSLCVCDINQKIRVLKRSVILKFAALVCFGLCFIWSNNASCAVLWCNPENTGIEDGVKKGTGYKSLHRSFSMMNSGDTVIIANGDWRKTSGMYIDRRHNPPNGDSFRYSRIIAETDWNVKLPYVHIENTKEEAKGYLVFKGIVFDNEFIGKGMTHISYHIHHTKFIRCGFLAHGLKGNTHTCGFGSSDSTRSINQYNLMEECVAWGSGRYVYYCKYGRFNIFRRCVARHDKNDSPKMFNFRAYACDYTVAQNCISIDSDRISNYAGPIDIETGGFWFGDQYGADGNAVEGCISIKDIQMAYYMSGDGRKTGAAAVINCVALDLSYTVPKITTLCALVLAQDEDVDVLNVTAVGATLEGQDGVYCKKSGNKTIANCILANIADEGIGINPSSETVSAYNNAFYNVGGGKYGDRPIRLNPFENGLRYPVRIESNSALSEAGAKGTICGATILKKIGVSGTLYGEPGWDEVTDENLWPFPNEKKIWELMRETVDGVSGKYGFCEDGQSLSNYIWGYLGNTVPPFHVRAAPGDGRATVSWDAPPEIALKTITGFNVYEVKNGGRILIGGTVMGNQTYSKTISGLVNGKSYEFAVTAIDKTKGESGLSYTVKVVPEKMEGSAPVKTLSDEPAEAKGPADLALEPTVKTLPAEAPAKVAGVKDKGAAPAAGLPVKEFTNQFGMDFVFIPPGVFRMGILSNKEGEQKSAFPHNVTLTKGFYMQKTEVTQGQWKEIMGENLSFFKECGDDCPLEQVAWNEAQLFIKRLNAFEKTNSYRLPTEAEWEYACRAGTTTPFSFGECLSTDQANYCGHYPLNGCEKGVYREKIVAVNEFPANAWGLTGMHGNVWEWCQDWFAPYPASAVKDPKGPPSGKRKVFRGGGWNSYAKACTSGSRAGTEPTNYFANLGFRVVKDL